MVPYATFLKLLGHIHEKNFTAGGTTWASKTRFLTSDLSSRNTLGVTSLNTAIKFLYRRFYRRHGRCRDKSSINLRQWILGADHSEHTIVNLLALNRKQTTCPVAEVLIEAWDTAWDTMSIAGDRLPYCLAQSTDRNRQHFYCEYYQVGKRKIESLRPLN